jgi:hypothetical protein
MDTRSFTLVGAHDRKLPRGKIIATVPEKVEEVGIEIEAEVVIQFLTEMASLVSLGNLT